MNFLRYWLAASVVVITGLAIWAFAPVLLFIFLLVLALGGISAAMIALAAALRSWRERS